jgi:hypothetical protein
LLLLFCELDSLVFTIFVALQELEFLLDRLDFGLKVSFIRKRLFFQLHIALKLLWSVAGFLKLINFVSEVLQEVLELLFRLLCELVENRADKRVALVD